MSEETELGKSRFIELTEGKKGRILTLVLLALAFLLPLTMCAILYKNEGFYPFVSNGLTPIMIDAQSQYIGYLRYYKSVLNNNGSLIYTLSKLYGGDFMSIFTYYLSSPFNLLLYFVSYEEIPSFFLWSSILKISFAGLNMYLLLRFERKTVNLAHLVFAVGYAFCSYAFVYMSNFMWLDGVMILPLVILGLDGLFEKKRYWLYALSIAYALISSWYIGVFICFFTLLFFFYRLYAEYGESKKNGKEGSKKAFKCGSYFLRFAVFSLIGGFIAGAFWLTAFSHFGGTKANSSGFSPNGVNLTLSAVLESLLENGYTAVKDIQVYYGWCTCFVSTVCLPFFLLFFVNRKYSWQERVAGLVVYLFYLICLYEYHLNVLMHGGKEPTWFPARYSFVVCFMTAYFGSKTADRMEGVKLGSYFVPVLAVPVVLSIVLNQPNYFKDTYVLSIPALVIYLATVALLFIASLFYQKAPKKGAIAFMAASVALVPLACYSSYRAAGKITDANKADSQYQTIEEYREDCAYQSDFDNLAVYDQQGNYRVENTFIRPGAYNEIDNDPLFYSFSGVSHYSSSENKDVENYTLKLGFQYNGFFEGYDGGSTLAANSFLGIKYIVDKYDSYYDGNSPLFIYNSPFEKIDSLVSANSDINYYVNPYALPLGFAVSSNAGTEPSPSFNDFFQFQNDLYAELSDQVYETDSNGKKTAKAIFKYIPVTCSPTSSDTSFTTDSDGNFFVTGSYGCRVNFTFTVPSGTDGDNLYFGWKDNDWRIGVTFDGSRREMTSYWHRGIRGFEGSENSLHSIGVTYNYAPSNSRSTPYVVYEDKAVLKEYIDAIKAQGANDLKTSKGLTSYGYKGSFNLNQTGGDFLFTLPYDKRMNIYVDGVKKETFKGLGIYTCCSLAGLDMGQHQIEISYKDQGLVEGIVLSALGLMSLAGFYIVGGVLKKKKAKKDLKAGSTENE